MAEGSDSRSFVFVVGGSCTGKTQLALNVGGKTGAPIINADSVQVFSRVDIGTAKPSLAEMQSCPHYLFSHVDPGQSYTAANYVNDVVRVVSENNLQKAMFVGGSGFYLQAIEKGLYPNVEPRPEIKERVWEMIDELGFSGVYEWLKEKDPEYGALISVNDHYRIRRGLEIMLSQNLTVTELKKEMEKHAQSPLPSHKLLKVGLYRERDELRKLVLQRAEKMVAAGFEDEVRKLLAEGYGDWSPMTSVGYKEVVQYLNGEFPREELIERIATSTMQLIKKQSTWFKRFVDIEWFHSEKINDAEERILQWFGSSSS